VISSITLSKSRRHIFKTMTIHKMNENRDHKSNNNNVILKDMIQEMSPAELSQLAQSCIDDISTSVVGIEMQRDERLRAINVPWLNDISQLKRRASI